MRKPTFYGACYIILKNELWEILFQKRTNTGFRDWYYQIPAWHIEWTESMKECMIRETKEELDINIVEKDLEIEHISHRVEGDRIYFDVYLSVKKYYWISKIAEKNIIEFQK